MFWVLFVLAVATVAVGFALARGSARTYTVPSTSMAPTIGDGERVLVSLGPDVRRGDVIVFSRPGVSDTFVKRLIGLPGGHVQCCATQGRIMVNGKPLA